MRSFSRCNLPANRFWRNCYDELKKRIKTSFREKIFLRGGVLNELSTKRKY